MKKLYTEEEVREIVYLECQSNDLTNKYKNKDIITQREHKEIKNFRKQLEKYSIFFKPETEELKNIERKLKDNNKNPSGGLFQLHSSPIRQHFTSSLHYH